MAQEQEEEGDHNQQSIRFEMKHMHDGMVHMLRGKGELVPVAVGTSAFTDSASSRSVTLNTGLCNIMKQYEGWEYNILGSRRFDWTCVLSGVHNRKITFAYQFSIMYHYGLLPGKPHSISWLVKWCFPIFYLIKNQVLRLSFQTVGKGVKRALEHACRLRLSSRSLTITERQIRRIMAARLFPLGKGDTPLLIFDVEACMSTQLRLSLVRAIFFSESALHSEFRAPPCAFKEYPTPVLT